MNALALKERFRLSRFVLGENPAPGPITLNHRRIFILPTPRGLGFALLTLLLFFIGFVYNNNLVYLLSFLLASTFFITTVHSFKSLSGLVISEGLAKPVFAGEMAAFPLHIYNPSAMPRPQIRIAGQIETVLSLPADSQNPTFVYRHTARRGWFEAGTITLYSTFPLGLFRVWSPLRFDLRVLVYPKPAVADLPFPQAALGANQEGASQKGNDDFYGLKNYEAGDSIKHIHWKAYAKGQGVFSKQYGGDSNGELWLELDGTPGYDLEERLCQLCRWVLDADKAGLDYGLCLPGVLLAPASGAQHRQSCLEALALCSP
ncbi:DUF58 domain-containing protein [Methylomicrobium lacus]|uniref:DUF58 domain-containing protein n=1 Tax=Methylomicrobium lacus TaxID=136992 RepID=UPI0035A82BDA